MPANRGRHRGEADDLGCDDRDEGDQPAHGSGRIHLGEQRLLHAEEDDGLREERGEVHHQLAQRLAFPDRQEDGLTGQPPEDESERGREVETEHEHDLAEREGVGLAPELDVEHHVGGGDRRGRHCPHRQGPTGHREGIEIETGQPGAGHDGQEGREEVGAERRVGPWLSGRHGSTGERLGGCRGIQVHETASARTRHGVSDSSLTPCRDRVCAGPSGPAAAGECVAAHQRIPDIIRAMPPQMPPDDPSAFQPVSTLVTAGLSDGAVDPWAETSPATAPIDMIVPTRAPTAAMRARERLVVFCMIPSACSDDGSGRFG